MTIRTILVGVDPSEGSRHALEWAAALAEPLGARVIAAQVFEPLAHLGEVRPGTDLRALRAETAAALEAELCAPLRERGLAYSARVLEGSPPTALADAADEADADLLVVGARRKGLLEGLVLGSTSMRLATLTARPVTIVHLPGAKR